MSDASVTTGLSIARALASERPQAMLPCPVCAAALRGENLEKHLAKAHRGPGGDAAATPYWTGPSRRVPPLIFAPLAAAVLWLVATRAGAVVVTPRIEVAIAGMFGVLFFALLALTDSGRFSARLTFTGDSFVLQPPLGLRPRTVSLPAKLEVGSGWEPRGTAIRVGDDVYWSKEGERRIGSYLRLMNGSESITVLATGGSVRDFWNMSGIRTGPRRHRYDIKLDAIDFVAIQYLLAGRALLVPKLSST